MANTDRPNGFVPGRHRSGGTPQRLGAYSIVNPSTNAFFSGDLVRMTGTADANGLPIIEDAAATETSCGVFAGCSFIDANGDQQFRSSMPSSQTMLTGTVATAYVYDDPEQLFVVQSSGAIVAANFGLNCDIIATAGSTFTGRSAHEAAVVYGATGQLHVHSLAKVIGNEIGTNSKLLVAIAEHQLRGDIVGF